MDDVSFDVPSTGIMALIGPDGAGKTTAFKVLSGHVRPKSGTVEVFGTSVSALGPAGPADRTWRSSTTTEPARSTTGASSRSLDDNGRHGRGTLGLLGRADGRFRRTFPPDHMPVDHMPVDHMTVTRRGTRRPGSTSAGSP
ncbi:ATP-binding cassette domain-containing protein [Nonomuraea sp. NPDC048916]|uniref:ATP-binding cassette domain-containing protein n=1 Tax=Nonomuraea sp. NPDC048916 TaxID=3154232 RepID=UPI0033C51147